MERLAPLGPVSLPWESAPPVVMETAREASARLGLSPRALTARAVRRKRRPAHMGHIEASAYVSHDGGPRLMRSVIYCRNEHGRAEHPTQKPIGIVEPLLLYACPPGGAVLDCFAGSGTTGIVAKRHGMSATLIEGDEVFVDVIHRRLLDDAPLLAGAA